MARLRVRFRVFSCRPLGPTAPDSNGPPWPGSSTTRIPSITSPLRTSAALPQGVRTRWFPPALPITATGTPEGVTRARGSPAGPAPPGGPVASSGAGACCRNTGSCNGELPSHRPLGAPAGTIRRAGRITSDQLPSGRRCWSPTSISPPLLGRRAAMRMSRVPAAVCTSRGVLHSQRQVGAPEGTKRRSGSRRSPHSPPSRRCCSATSMRPPLRILAWSRSCGSAWAATASEAARTATAATAAKAATRKPRPPGRLVFVSIRCLARELVESVPAGGRPAHSAAMYKCRRRAGG